MELEEFAEFLVTNIVLSSDLVKVKKFDTGESIVLEILVSDSDMSRIIGKQGKVANSIRNLIQLKAFNDGIKNIKVNINSF